MSFETLRKAVKALDQTREQTTYRIAILGAHATQFLRKSMELQAKLADIKLEVFEAEYNQIEREIIDQRSGLYEFKPDCVYISYSARKLREKFYGLTDEKKPTFFREFAQELTNNLGIVSSRIDAKILISNFEEINDNVFGNYAAKSRLSFVNQMRRLNVELMNIVEDRAHVYQIDVHGLWSRMGDEYSFENSMYVNADLIYSLDMCALISNDIIKIIQGLLGRFKKCIILDLDNTTWGGIIGDDGLSNIQVGDLGIGKAFTELQSWVKQLKNRGIILAICSKNDEQVAKEPFQKHPEMVLRLEDIAIFVANWENKADNIRYIQEILNIGFDSMVFLDDNPVEREIVGVNLPEVTVPALPEDPADYLSYVSSLNLFETISYSSSDTGRTKQYQEESKRLSSIQTYTNMDEFLASLDMVSTVVPFNEFDVPRIAQLSQRSNQFNLRTIRYTEDEINLVKADTSNLHYSVRLNDKFGEYGLVSILILKPRNADTLFIDTWIMSCRVLKRGLEQFVLNTIAADGKRRGYKTIEGEYVATAKNNIVKDHFEDLGFTKNTVFWDLDLTKFAEKTVFIHSE